MSLEGAWDLRSNAAPRSVCVFGAAASPSHQETNPFEIAAGVESPSAHAVVYGTERGSLHYRTYPSPDDADSNHIGKVTLPLGSTGGRSSTLPRSYFPVDLTGGSLPGAVVNVIAASHTRQPIFLVLVDDNRGTSHSQPGQYAATLVTLQHGSFSKLSNATLPSRISCATYHHSCGFVVCAGRTITTIPPQELPDDTGSSNTTSINRSKSRKSKHHRMDFSHVVLPTPGARGGQDAVTITRDGKVLVVAVGNSVYAVAGTEAHGTDDPNHPSSTPLEPPTSECVKVVSFAQSSQVHPVIVLDIQDKSMDPDWSSLFVANGRESAVIDLQYSHNRIICSPPRNGMVTLASPILAAATSWPWLAVLTSDGLISIRSPSCLAIALKTVEVGTRPNDFFVLRTFSEVHSTAAPWILATSYSGQAKIFQCHPDTAQDLADRLMRHSIDAFGSNGFPRSQLAEALNASFTATSYVGPEPTGQARDLLKQYLEAILGLADFEGGSASGWPTEMTSSSSMSAAALEGNSPKNAAAFHFSGSNAFDEASHQQQLQKHPSPSRATVQSTTVSSSLSPVINRATPNSLVTGTALLCLVCTQLSPTPKASLANRAAKSCAAKMGVIVNDSNQQPILSSSACRVSELVADRLLSEANKSISLLNKAPGPSMSRHSSSMEFVEAATWLLRSCGKHERAIAVLGERMQQHRALETTATVGFWSQIKYESYTATHLSELWATSKVAACQLVLQSPATQRLLIHNPHLGLNVFTVLHPQDRNQWSKLSYVDDPLAKGKYPAEVVKLLKSINPSVSMDASSSHQRQHDEGGHALPMDSGRALAVAFLESAMGVSTGRPTEEDEFDSLSPDQTTENHIADFHDELCYLLLEGVISELGDNDEMPPDSGSAISPSATNVTPNSKPNDEISETDSRSLGHIYLDKLRRFLRWPLAKVRSDRLLTTLPKSFLQEKALVLGRLGRHEDALRILYCECKSMDLALEYCDLRHERRQAKLERAARMGGNDMRRDDGFGNPFAYDNTLSGDEGCAYLPLVKVALESDSDKKRGTTAAIQVLALRRSAIDRAAALRLLPKNVPVSAVARPFLIPALVESESQARRLKVVSSLLRARHSALKQQLTEAQLKAQANLHVVPQLRSMNLGDPLHSTKAFKARPSSSASSTFPDVVIVKHFFPRHVVIQAKVTNHSAAVDGRSIGNTVFVVAESSEEAIQPQTQVPIKVLPFRATGSTWCVLAAAPHRMEGTAILTCELRYTVLAGDASFGTSSGRTYVEELQDLEIFSSHFA